MKNWSSNRVKKKEKEIRPIFCRPPTQPSGQIVFTRHTDLHSQANKQLIQFYMFYG